MKIIICHSKTKREINGPFNICGSRADLLQLAEAIQEACGSDEEPRMVYGWVNIQVEQPDEEKMAFRVFWEQKPITNEEPEKWDWASGG